MKVKVGRTWSDDISRALSDTTEQQARRGVGGQRVYHLTVGRLTVLIDGRKRRAPKTVNAEDLFR